MIYRMLEIGMDNLSKGTVDALDEVKCGNDNGMDLVVYPKTDPPYNYGFFIVVPEDREYEEIKEKLPDDLKTILEYASARNCAWVMVDIDAENNNLPKYDYI